MCNSLRLVKQSDRRSLLTPLRKTNGFDTKPIFLHRVYKAEPVSSLADLNFVMDQFPWLSFIIFFPFLAALLIPLIPDENGRTVRWYALVVGLIDFAAIVYAFVTQYDIGSSGMQLYESYSWVPQLDLRWSVGVDGLSMPLVLLTGFITTLAILASWPVTFKPKLFYLLLLSMYAWQIGVFAVQDMLLVLPGGRDLRPHAYADFG